MTLIQAALRVRYASPIARAFIHKPHGKAANDNGQIGTHDSKVLDASLRYFAKHGLSAAAEAHKQAEACFHAGDAAEYSWWLSICRMLDQRMATKLSKKYEAEDILALA